MSVTKDYNGLCVPQNSEEWAEICKLAGIQLPDNVYKVEHGIICKDNKVINYSSIGYQNTVTGWSTKPIKYPSTYQLNNYKGETMTLYRGPKTTDEKWTAYVLKEVNKFNE